MNVRSTTWICGVRSETGLNDPSDAFTMPQAAGRRQLPTIIRGVHSFRGTPLGLSATDTTAQPLLWPACPHVPRRSTLKLNIGPGDPPRNFDPHT